MKLAELISKMSGSTKDKVMIIMNGEGWSYYLLGESYVEPTLDCEVVDIVVDDEDINIYVR